MDVSVGVKYDIYFDAASMTVYVMPDGQKPAALAAMQRMMSTRAGENKSNFADFKRGRMNNIETHDEERIGYKAITWGQEYVKGDWAVISKRMQAVYAFHFLTPYPKMMWQFGELGYDFSINANDSGVVGTGVNSEVVLAIVLLIIGTPSNKLRHSVVQRTTIYILVVVPADRLAVSTMARTTSLFTPGPLAT